MAFEAFTEDQNPVMGETPEVRNLFVSAGYQCLRRHGRWWWPVW